MCLWGLLCGAGRKRGDEGGDLGSDSNVTINKNLCENQSQMFRHWLLCVCKFIYRYDLNSEEGLWVLRTWPLLNHNLKRLLVKPWSQMARILSLLLFLVLNHVYLGIIRIQWNSPFLEYSSKSLTNYAVVKPHYNQDADHFQPPKSSLMPICVQLHLPPTALATDLSHFPTPAPPPPP